MVAAAASSARTSSTAVNVLKITVPPLRERVERHPAPGRSTSSTSTTRAPAAATRPPPARSPSALAPPRRAYRWPGNIRELENEIERMLVLGGDADELGVEPAVAAHPRRPAGGRRRSGAPGRPSTLARQRRPRCARSWRAVEADVILQGLIRTHWNKSQLAKELGISRSNLIQKCTYYGLDRKD